MGHILPIASLGSFPKRRVTVCGLIIAAPQSLKDFKLPFMQNAQPDPVAQRHPLDLLAKLNAEHLRHDPANEAIEGIAQSAELAFHMQREMPEVMSIAKESPKTLELYGIGDSKPTDHFGRVCLMARRFSEAGVRFVQVNHTFWDDHGDIVKNIRSTRSKPTSPSPRCSPISSSAA